MQPCIDWELTVTMLSGLLQCALLIATASAARAPGPCLVTSRGAVGDNKTDDTVALQAVLDDVSCSSVIFPAPLAFLSRALNLSAMSNRTLLIETGAELVVWRDPKTYSTSGANNSEPASATPSFASSLSAIRRSVFVCELGGRYVDRASHNGLNYRWWWNHYRWRRSLV